MSMKRNMIAAGITLALATPVANAALVTDLYGPYDWTTDSANFTMLDGNGNSVGGTNNVDMFWDGNGYTSETDYTGPGGAANVTASSTTPFFGENWTAHDIQVFTPGTYNFDTTLGGGNNESGILTATVNEGQLGMHMLFDWGSDSNIDLFVVADPMSVFGPGIARSSSFNFSTFRFNCVGPPAVPLPTAYMMVLIWVVMASRQATKSGCWHQAMVMVTALWGFQWQWVARLLVSTGTLMPT